MGMGMFYGFIVLQVHTFSNVFRGSILSFIKILNRAKFFMLDLGGVSCTVRQLEIFDLLRSLLFGLVFLHHTLILTSSGLEGLEVLAVPSKDENMKGKKWPTLLVATH